jgi:hypothetical protein
MVAEIKLSSKESRRALTVPAEAVLPQYKRRKLCVCVRQKTKQGFYSEL